MELCGVRLWRPPEPAALCGPACSDSVPLACPVTVPWSLWIWKQNCTAACWVRFKHYLHLHAGGHRCGLCWNVSKGRRESWIQPSAKIGEPQGFLQMMLSPLWSHKIPCFNSKCSGSEGTLWTMTLWEIPGLMPVLTLTSLFSPTPKSHSLLEQYFNLWLKTSRFLIHHALVSCSICRKLYCTYLGFCCKNPNIVNIYLLHLDISQKYEWSWFIKQVCAIWVGVILLHKRLLKSELAWCNVAGMSNPCCSQRCTQGSVYPDPSVTELLDLYLCKTIDLGLFHQT